MALVSVTNVEVLSNPAPVTQNFQFEITFECIANLADDIEWKLIYVGSAESEAHDQELDSILVGPIPVGLNKFVFEAPHPDFSKLPETEITGVTVVLITCSYQGNEFVRIGYYVNNDFTDPALRENPPQDVPVAEKVQLLSREILANKPRVTRYNIAWDPQQQPVGFGQQQMAGAAPAVAMGGMVGMVEQQQPNPMKAASYSGMQGHDSGVAPMES